MARFRLGQTIRPANLIAMKTIRIWLIRIVVITLLTAAVIKSPTAFVAALLGVILAGYLFVIWLKWKFWRIVSPLADVGNMTREVTLNLQKTDRPFSNPDKVNANIAVLKEKGFSILGTFTARQLHRTNIVVANNQPEGMHAIIIDIEHLGVTTEFCSRYEDGKSFTCSNTRLPAVLPRPDIHPISSFPEADVQTVLSQFMALRPPTAICKIEDVAIPAQIESLYNEIKVYEIETIEKTANTEAQLLENFIINSGWSAIEWHRRQNNIIIVHNGIKDYDLVSRYENLMDTEDEQYQALKGKIESIIKKNTPIDAFKILSSEIPLKHRLEKVLELDAPVPAHVYLKKSETSSGSSN